MLDASLSEISTEGFVGFDLEKLASRAVNEMMIRNFGRANASVNLQDILAARKSLIPLSLEKISQTESTTSWKDIGGLDSVKQLLIQTLEWPTKYASIYAACPLRLRSG
jgi:peroxin-1